MSTKLKEKLMLHDMNTVIEIELYAPEKERGNCCKDFLESDEKITIRLFLPVTREGGC